MIKELVFRNRSYRRFYQEEEVSTELLYDLIDTARLSNSAANLQPLRYAIINNALINRKVFSSLRWAGYLENWQGPEEGERPACYIIVLAERGKMKHHHYDAGIAVQSIMLRAVEEGLGGCIFASVNRENLQQELLIPDRYEILLVLALGKPKEIVVIEEIERDGDVRYRRDEDGVHHVPKRKLEDILVLVEE